MALDHRWRWTSIRALGHLSRSTKADRDLSDLILAQHSAIVVARDERQQLMLKASRTHDSLLYYNSPIDVIKRVMTMARTRVSPKYQVVPKKYGSGMD